MFTHPFTGSVCAHVEKKADVLKTDEKKNIMKRKIDKEDSKKYR